MPRGESMSWAEKFDGLVRPVLAPGEVLRAASPLTADPGTTEDVSLRDELAALADPTIWLGLGSHPGAAGQRAIFGRGVDGEPGSRGHQVFTAVHTATAPALCVTDRRLVVVERTTVPRPGSGRLARLLGAGDEVVTLQAEVPREQVAGAVAAPKGVARRGRMLVRFTDGSVCALLAALPSVRDEVVAVLAAPSA